MDPQYWWLIAGVLLFVVEIFTPGFFAASLGIGAFGAAVAAFFTTSLEIQLIVFSIVSLLSIFLLRPVIKRYFYQTGEVLTNADALIGKTGTVLKAIDPSTNLGRMRIDGDEWQFTPDESVIEPIKAGEKVRVIARDSIILTVLPIK